MSFRFYEPTMAKTSANELGSRDDSLEDHDPLHTEDGLSEMQVIPSTSNLLTVEKSTLSTTPPSKRREKASNSCKDSLKKYSKFWNFLYKKKTDCSTCDPEAIIGDADDQSETVAVSCLCTGSKRQSKQSQEFLGDVSSFQADGPLHGSDLSEQALHSIPESGQSATECSSSLAVGTVDVGILEQVPRSAGSLNVEAAAQPSVQPCCFAILNSNSRPGAARSSCISRNQSTPSFRTMIAGCNAASCGAANEDIFVDCCLNPDHRHSSGFIPQTVHTQVDFIHYLVPDLKKIVNCSYYWGIMDRYEAEHLLDGRPEGTFLLRDSAQEEFLFSVSFRRYSRSLHARVEHHNHRFSFDAHDTNVFASPSVCGLIEHYKDPACCMFFEPMLTLPLVRTFPFSLQHLCRAVICSIVTYDGISYLPIPKSLHQFLQYYHYKKKVRVRRFDATPNH